MINILLIVPSQESDADENRECPNARTNYSCHLERMRRVSRKFEPVGSNFLGFSPALRAGASVDRGANAPLGQNDINFMVLDTPQNRCVTGSIL